MEPITWNATAEALQSVIKYLGARKMADIILALRYDGASQEQIMALTTIMHSDHQQAGW